MRVKVRVSANFKENKKMVSKDVNSVRKKGEPMGASENFRENRKMI